MNIEETMYRHKRQELDNQLHHFKSTIGNALERIGILIDEDDPDEAKSELDELREGLRKIGEPATYVVVYDRTPFDDDFGDTPEDREEYYGYFDTPAEAEKLYRDMIVDHERRYHNARICMQVGTIDG